MAALVEDAQEQSFRPHGVVAHLSGMPKVTTYVLRAGQLVEKSSAPPLDGGVFVMSDIKPFRTQDGKEIGSRSSLRAYEQANGVKQVGNDNATLHGQLRAKVYGERE